MFRIKSCTINIDSVEFIEGVYVPISGTNETTGLEASDDELNIIQMKFQGSLERLYND